MILRDTNNGFTLIELMVSIAIFAVVSMACMSAILTVLNSNRKAGNLSSVMDNLSFTLDDMTRSIRFGTNYHCDSSGILSQPQDCDGSNNDNHALTVLDSNNNLVTFSLSSGQIMRTINGGIAYALTSPDVDIQTLSFFVFGSANYASGDLSQPRVIVLIKGYVAGANMTDSSFTLETTISQRRLDF